MRRRQLDAFAKIDTIMSSGGAPSVRAADTVLATMRKSRRGN
jgi:lipid-A-disaccharide synthase